MTLASAGRNLRAKRKLDGVNECRNDPVRDRVTAIGTPTDRDTGRPGLAYEQSSVGAVRATEPSTVSCGTVIPRDPQNSRVHAPPAQTTACVATLTVLGDEAATTTRQRARSHEPRSR